MDEPMLRAWMQEPVPPASLLRRAARPLGRPSRLAVSPNIAGDEAWRWSRRPARGEGGKPERLAIRFAADDRRWRAANGAPMASACWAGAAARSARRRCRLAVSSTASRCAEPAGDPRRARVELEHRQSTGRSAIVVVRLSDVAPDGAATRVTYGVLNLTHRDSHEQPTAAGAGRALQGEGRS